MDLTGLKSSCPWVDPFLKGPGDGLFPCLFHILEAMPVFLHLWLPPTSKPAVGRLSVSLTLLTWACLGNSA